MTENEIHDYQYIYISIYIDNHVFHFPCAWSEYKMSASCI